MATFTPQDFSLYQEVDAPLAQPFRALRIDEMVSAAFTIPPTGYLGASDADSQIAVYLLKPVTQQQIDAATASLSAIASDPTRNNLSASEQAAADLAAELATINANIAALTADIAAINGTGGYKDQINAATTGLKDRLLTNTAWNALSTGAKADLLRDILRGVGGATPFNGVLDIQIGQLNIDVDEAKSAKTSLKEAKNRLKIV